MKPGITTWWVPAAGADLDALEKQHQRAFPGNQLAIVGGMVKVAVPEGEDPPKDGTTSAPDSDSIARSTANAKV